MRLHETQLLLNGGTSKEQVRRERELTFVLGIGEKKFLLKSYRQNQEKEIIFQIGGILNESA